MKEEDTSSDKTANRIQCTVMIYCKSVPANLIVRNEHLLICFLFFHELAAHRTFRPRLYEAKAKAKQKDYTARPKQRVNFPTQFFLLAEEVLVSLSPTVGLDLRLQSLNHLLLCKLLS